MAELNKAIIGSSGNSVKSELSDLLACPFCGDNNPRKIQPNDDYTWCTNPSCAIYDVEIRTEKWNRRAIIE